MVAGESDVNPITMLWMAALTCVALAGCSGAGAAPGGTPDLVVERPSVSDDAPAAGTTFTLSATVRNAGKGASDATTLNFYESADHTITTGDKLVGTDRVPKLAPSETSAPAVSPKAPSTPGTYYYGICVVAVADDSNTANDCSGGLRVQVPVPQAPAPESSPNPEAGSVQSNPQPPPSQPSESESSPGADPLQDDFPATTDTTGMVSMGGEVGGRISDAADEDWFAVDMKAAQPYRIEAERVTSGYLPTLLGIYDADGELVTAKARPGTSLGTLAHTAGYHPFYSLLFTPVTAGRYYIAVGGVEDGSPTEFGGYRLVVAETTSDDYSATTATTGRITVGSSMEGTFEWAGDEDWVAVELDAQTVYRVDIEPISADPALAGIQNSAGTRQPGTSNKRIDALSPMARVFFTPSTAGTYYVAARGQTAGRYRVSVTAKGDDYAGDRSTTGRLTVGGSVTGEIEASDDWDWFAIDLVEDNIYLIDLEGQSTNKGTARSLVLSNVYEDRGAGRRPAPVYNITERTQLALPGSGEGSNARLLFTAAVSGIHYVTVIELFPGSIGTYTLSVTQSSDDFPWHTRSMRGAYGNVTVGGSAQGELEDPTDQDWFAVNLNAGTNYRIMIDGRPTGGGTLERPQIWGVSRDFAEVPILGTAYELPLFFEPDWTGRYAIGVRNQGLHSGKPRSAGTYTVSVAVATDDFPASTETTGQITVGGSATGTVETPDDRDWFRVALVAGTTYRIDATGSATGDDTLEDPYLYAIHDAEGRLLADQIDRGSYFWQVGITPAWNAWAEFEATATAVHYISAGGDPRSLKQYMRQGTYTLTVKQL